MLADKKMRFLRILYPHGWAMYGMVRMAKMMKKTYPSVEMENRMVRLRRDRLGALEPKRRLLIWKAQIMYEMVSAAAMMTYSA